MDLKSIFDSHSIIKAFSKLKIITRLLILASVAFGGLWTRLCQVESPL